MMPIPAGAHAGPPSIASRKPPQKERWVWLFHGTLSSQKERERGKGEREKGSDGVRVPYNESLGCATDATA